MSNLVKLVVDTLARDIKDIDKVLAVKDRVREEAIQLSRTIIRASAEVTRMLHLGRYNDAYNKLVEAQKGSQKLLNLLNNHPDLLYSGLVNNCISEYVEASIVYNLIVEKKMLSYKELSVPIVPYLQGLGDVVGELRRHIIDLLRREKYVEAETYLDIMETIYQELRRLNYPDALAPGLRHKVDVARRLIEDTKILYLNTINANKLMSRLDRVSELFTKGS